LKKSFEALHKKASGNLKKVEVGEIEVFLRLLSAKEDIDVVSYVTERTRELDLENKDDSHFQQMFKYMQLGTLSYSIQKIVVSGEEIEIPSFVESDQSTDNTQKVKRPKFDVLFELLENVDDLLIQKLYDAYLNVIDIAQSDLDALVKYDHYDIDLEIMKAQDKVKKLEERKKELEASKKDRLLGTAIMMASQKDSNS
jgi:hypothetical protein